MDIFPHGAERGTYSNGVQSVAVQHTQPLTLDSYSYSLHGRGAVFNQRRWAPWTGRSGHLHLASDLFFTTTDDLNRWQSRLGFHLIAGGRNATNYFNDVWLYVTRVNETQPVLSGNGRWHQLPAAPWSPRAFMSASVLLIDPDVAGQPVKCLVGSRCQLNVSVVGGEVGHACGLPELGRCVAESWQLTITVDEQAWPHFRLQWSEKATQLPFPAVCGSLLMFVPPTSNRAVGPTPAVRAVMGGQLSYEDPSCSSPPVSSNSVWYSDNLWPFVHWRQGADAPWSPRRSMLTQSDYAPADFTVMGGARYGSFSCSDSTQRCRLTAAQLFADVYVCNLGLNGSLVDCDWTPSRPRGSVSSRLWGPAGSLPVPLAYLPQGWTGGWRAAVPDWSGVVFGGVTSASGLQGWLHGSNVSGAVDGWHWSAPASVIEQPSMMGALFPPPTTDDVIARRYGQPLVYDLSEAELNDDSGPFRTGAPGLMTSFMRQYSPPFSSAQQLLSQQFSSLPASYSAQSAAGSANTSRGLLDFVYTRHSYGLGSSSNVLGENKQLLSLSGGASGSDFHSDWLELQQLRGSTGLPAWPQGLVSCLSPDDPSFAPLLGPGRSTGCWFNFDCDFVIYSVAYCAPYTCDWECGPDAHLSPPAASDVVTLTCLPDGLWHDTDSLSFRRCVKNTLNCSHPLVDLGGAACELPLPFITNITAAPADAEAAVDACRQVDALSIGDCPIAELALEIIGGWFSFPLKVWVGGHECQYVQLRDVGDDGWLCVNSSAAGGRQCEQYGPRIVCVIPSIGGWAVPVVVQAGASDQLAEARDWRQPQLALSVRPSVSYAQPTIVSLSSDDCEPVNGSAVQLVSCPNTRAFHLLIMGLNLHSPSSDYSRLHSDTSVVLSGVQQRLGCSRLPVQGGLNCSVQPGIGSELPLLVSIVGVGDNGWQSFLSQPERPLLSYRQCPAGTYSNHSTDARVQPGTPWAQLCPLCPPGSSTDGASDAQQCSPCAAGRYNNGTGHGVCELCPAGTWSGAGSASCLNCSLNSFSSELGASVCASCSLNQYVSYSPLNSSFVQCLPCLSEAVCWPNGSITAAYGSFVLIDGADGSISAASCRGSACWQGSACLSSDSARSYVSSSPRIPLSGLPVINCCATGRVQAADNLLCADCLPGYAEWNGSCVRCSGVNVEALSCVLLLAALLLYGLHRLPGSADSVQLQQLLYALQMSLLFATHDTVPQLLSLVNFDLLGDFHAQQARPSLSSQQQQDLSTGLPTPVCLAPLQAWDKLGLHVLMPLCFVLGIALIFLLQLTVRCLLFRSQGQLPRFRLSSAVYRTLFTAVDADIEAERQLSAACAPPSEPAAPLLQHSGLACVTEQAPSPVSDQCPRLWGVGLLAYNRSLLRLLLYSYNNVSLAILTFFHCQPLDASHGSRLYSYPSVDCTSSAYRKLLPAFIAALILLVLGGPVALLLLLYRHRRAAQQPAGTAAEAVRQDRAARIAYARYGLLYAAFRDSCWHWSGVGLLQRAALILVLVFVPASEAFTWLSALNLSFLTTHVLVQPYRSCRDNRTDSALLFLLTLQTIMYAHYPPSGVTNAVAAVVSAIVIVSALALKAAEWAARRPAVQFAATRALGWLRQRSAALSAWRPASAASAVSRSCVDSNALLQDKENEEL